MEVILSDWHNTGAGPRENLNNLRADLFQHTATKGAPCGLRSFNKSDYVYHFLVCILLAAPNSDGLAMVVDLPPLLLLRPHPIDESVEEHLNPGHHLGEDQPDINQLHVSRLGKAA